MGNKLEPDYIAAVLGCRGLQSSAALPTPGVIAVLTGEDVSPAV
jgi:hypothetical protein